MTVVVTIAIHGLFHFVLCLLGREGSNYVVLG